MMHAPRGTISTLKECTELEYILLGDLRDLLDDPDSDESRRWLNAVLEALLETLPQEFALKSVDGYLSEVMIEFPSWDTQVERLAAQHFDLFRRLHRLRERLAGGNPIEVTVERLRDDLEVWMEAFIAHHRQERQLLHEAINLDVGCGD